MLPIDRLAILKKSGFSIFLLILITGLDFSGVIAQQNGITSPVPGDVLSGVVEVTGTAVHTDYLRYELAFLNEANQAAGWIVFAEGSSPVQAGTLAVWDTTVGREAGAPVFPDGRYRLRLRVVKTDYNYDEYFVTDLTIVNSGPTPEPTVDETAVALTAVAQPALVGTQTNDSGSSFQQLTPLPSLTPFPTPTALATAVGSQAGNNTPPTADSGGVLGQLQDVDTGQFSQAFMSGIKVTLAVFGLLLLYLFIRWVARRLWRVYWASKK